MDAQACGASLVREAQGARAAAHRCMTFEYLPATPSPGLAAKPCRRLRSLDYGGQFFVTSCWYPQQARCRVMHGQACTHIHAPSSSAISRLYCIF